MATSRQIGWDQESNLIYQIVKQLERLNQIIPNNQPALAPMMKRQIGWSQQSNLYYEWLRETDILTQHFANCCNTTTTTTTLPLVFREGFGYTLPLTPCQLPEPVQEYTTYYVRQDCFDNLTVGCYLYADELLTPVSEGYYIGWTEGVTYFYVNSLGEVVNINVCPQS